MTVALSSRWAVLTPPWVKRPLWKAAREVPSWHIAPALTGDLTDLVAGADLVTFTNSSPAWGFNSSGILVQPTANVPFIEYDPATGACLGWRIWDAVTNLCVYSSEIDNAAWQKNQCNVVANQAVAPDGTLTADKVTATGTDMFLQRYPISGGASGQTVTASIWLKGEGSSIGKNGFIAVATNSGIGTAATFTVTANWQRVSCTRTTPAGDTNGGLRIDLTDPSAVGDVVYAWGAQLNTGPLAPYVPTEALTASSTADVASITGAAFAGIWNQAAGTIYAEATTSVSSAPVFTARATASAGDRMQLAFGSGGQSAVVTSNVVQAIFSTSTASKRALAFAANDFALAYGSTIETDTSGTLPTVNYATIGKFDFGGGETLNGYVREMATLKSRRPNSNLQSMTQ